MPPPLIIGIHRYLYIIHSGPDVVILREFARKIADVFISYFLSFSPTAGENVFPHIHAIDIPRPDAGDENYYVF